MFFGAGSLLFENALAIYMAGNQLVTGQDLQNTTWPAVRYFDYSDLRVKH